MVFLKNNWRPSCFWHFGIDRDIIQLGNRDFHDRHTQITQENVVACLYPEMPLGIFRVVFQGILPSLRVNGAVGMFSSPSTLLHTVFMCVVGTGRRVSGNMNIGSICLRVGVSFITVVSAVTGQYLGW